MIRVSHRVGRHTWVSVPFWLAAFVYVFWAAAILAVVVVVGLALAAAAVLYLLGLLGQRAAVRWRRQRAAPK